MSKRAMSPVVGSPMRHIIFFGEVGAGKSSIINLLLGANRAPVSNDSRPCTQHSARYETLLHNRRCCLWDTRGLGEARNFFQTILGWGAEKELKKLLKERHRNREIDLLVYCVRGSRATAAMVKNYENFCAISRRLAAPVAIVVTHLQRETDMDDWWRRNAYTLSQLKLDFDDHACITALPGHHHQEQSKRKLEGLISRHYSWEAKASGSYFGSPVQIPTQTVPPRRQTWLARGLMPKRKSDVDNGRLHPRDRINSSSSTTPTTPTVIPPTPCGLLAPMDIPLVSDPPVSSGEEPSSMGSSPCSVLYNSSVSSHTSQSESSMEGIEGFSIPDLTLNVKRRKENFPTHSGAFGDVWECDLVSGSSPRKVAVKAVRTKPEEKDNHIKKLRRELKIWRTLDHKNVVPLLGVVSGFGRLPSMVSPWFSNGSLYKYLVTNQHTLHPSKRRCLLRDIAAGLSYLHSRDIVHGDLHSGNVLINDAGTACLTDFGLSFVDDFVRTSYLNSSICGNVVFADPALVNQVSNPSGIVHPTKPCDVYSFGGLILHVLSGKMPYADIHPHSIHRIVMNGKRPQIPHNITSRRDELLIRQCWDHEKHNRPSAVTLLSMFGGPV